MHEQKKTTDRRPQDSRDFEQLLKHGRLLHDRAVSTQVLRFFYALASRFSNSGVSPMRPGVQGAE